MFMFMLPALRGMKVFDVAPDDGPKEVVADGEADVKRGGGDARKLVPKEEGMA